MRMWLLVQGQLFIVCSTMYYAENKASKCEHMLGVHIWLVCPLSQPCKSPTMSVFAPKIWYSLKQTCSEMMSFEFKSIATKWRNCYRLGTECFASNNHLAMRNSSSVGLVHALPNYFFWLLKLHIYPYLGTTTIWWYGTYFIAVLSTKTYVLYCFFCCGILLAPCFFPFFCGEGNSPDGSNCLLPDLNSRELVCVSCECFFCCWGTSSASCFFLFLCSRDDSPGGGSWLLLDCGPVHASCERPLAAAKLESKMSTKLHKFNSYLVDMLILGMYLVSFFSFVVGEVHQMVVTACY